MTDRLAEIEERLRKATPGPWHYEANSPAALKLTPNEELIIHAPEDITWLVSEVKRITDAADFDAADCRERLAKARAEVKELREREVKA